MEGIIARILDDTHIEIISLNDHELIEVKATEFEVSEIKERLEDDPEATIIVAITDSNEIGSIGEQNGAFEIFA